MVHVLEEVGYHVVIIQEAWVQQLSQLDRDKWTFKERAGQFVGARRPSWVECIGGQHVSKKIWWAAFTVHFDEPRAGRKKLGILSLHLINDRDQRPVAAPADIVQVLSAAPASAFLSRDGLGAEIDICF